MTPEQELNEKWSIHSAIQSAIESAHNNPAPQTIKMFDEIKADIKEIKDDVKANLIQATKTNGRVSKQEEWSENAQKILDGIIAKVEEDKDKIIGKVEENKDEYQKDKSRVQGIVWVLGVLMLVVPTLCTFVFGLYLKNRDYQIDNKLRKTAEEVVTQLEAKYDLEIK